MGYAQPLYPAATPQRLTFDSMSK